MLWGNENKTTVLNTDADRNVGTVINQTVGADNTVINTEIVATHRISPGTVLCDVYTVKEELGVVAGEADLYICSFAAREYIAKVYRRKIAAKADVITKLASIHSPYVARVFAIGEYNGYPVEILPYYRNGSLAGKMFSFDQLKYEIIPTVNEGLHILHSNGIIHKDVKPSNIMLNNDGRTAAIIDFGISSIIDNGSTVIVTKTGLTPEYSAPETFRNLFLNESDYYSFGITIYELYCGHSPSQRLTGEQIEQFALLQKLPLPDEMEPELKDLINALTYPDIRNRNDKSNPNRRWGYEEVRNWCDDIHQVVPGMTNVPEHSNQIGYFSDKASKDIMADNDMMPYRFAGQIVSNSKVFARLLNSHWDEAKKHLFRGLLLDHTKKGSNAELTSYLMDLEEEAETGDPDVIMFKCLYKIDPTLRAFLWKGKEYSSLQDLGNNCLAAIKANDVPFIEMMEELLDKGILSCYVSTIEETAKQHISALSAFETECKLNSSKSRPARLISEAKLGAMLAGYSSFEELMTTDTALAKVITKAQTEMRALEERIKRFKTVGAIVEFGTYPQITYSGTDNTPIEWQVLDVKGDRVLLLSKYGLDAVPYNNKKENVTWESCSLRSWLNNDFINKAFSSAEKKALQMTQLDNRKCHLLYHPEISGGNNTQDYVFLLSLDELGGYFNLGQKLSDIIYSEDRRMYVSPTAYAIMHGAEFNDSSKRERDGVLAGAFWVRCPSYNNLVDIVCRYVGGTNDFVTSTSNVVRPACWVDTSSEVFSEYEDITANDRNTNMQNTFNSEKKISGWKSMFFGTYPQTYSGMDSTPIEWLVLEVRGNKALITSKYCLDMKPYDESNANSVTWETCTLRKWLNTEFMSKAFTHEEQKAIIKTRLDNGKRQIYYKFKNGKGSGGNDTEDSIFLLSCAEANEYFGILLGNGDNVKRNAAPTMFAIKKGAGVYPNKTEDTWFSTWWWLRSTGDNTNNAMSVVDDGVSSFMLTSDSAIRPTMWVDITMEPFIELKKIEDLKQFDIETSSEEISQHFTKGDIIKLGRYPQTEKGTDRTQIEWQILAIKDNNALLISRYGLDELPYNEAIQDITWEKCSLRVWLNKDFLNVAFNNQEKAVILETSVNNDSSQCYSENETHGGNNTRDRIFLLSYTEANRYFGVASYSEVVAFEDNYDDNDNMNNLLSRVAPTPYIPIKETCLIDNQLTGDYKIASSWWLRSPGDSQNCAAMVDNYGCLSSYSVNERFLIRPAIFVDLNQLNLLKEQINDLDCGSKKNCTVIHVERSKLKVGKTILFGSYPQTTNGNEMSPIRWTILDMRGDKALLISKYGLDSKPYNTNESDVDWENSSLRSWLNNYFIEKAFTSKERNAIRQTMVKNGDNQIYNKWGTCYGRPPAVGGNDTMDHIFLLSYFEAFKYFGIKEHDWNIPFDKNKRAQIVPTLYAIEHYAFREEHDGYVDGEGIEACYWWLRSPGFYQNTAAFINVRGFLKYEDVTCATITVRPALWVDINTLTRRDINQVT